MCKDACDEKEEGVQTKGSVFPVMVFSNLVSQVFSGSCGAGDCFNLCSEDAWAALAVHPDTDADGQAAGHRMIMITDD